MKYQPVYIDFLLGLDVPLQAYVICNWPVSDLHAPRSQTIPISQPVGGDM
jgi:hypothetical protein